MIRQRLRGGWRRLKYWVEGDRPVSLPAVLANNYLTGEGIEIGALFNPLVVPRGCHVRYVDRLPVDELRRQYPNLADKPLVPVDVVDDGERLGTVPDASQDFVIANHFLEHCQDPIGALVNFFRVLRPGGVAYLTVPDKRFTFDVHRPVTTLDHLKRDHAEGPDWSRDDHYLEFARLAHGSSTDEEARVVAADMAARGFSIHFHVWTQKEFLELLTSLQDELEFDFEAVCKNEIEVIAVLRKRQA
jgi:SAM-dependent methyltransferase